ncbi:hypothetical protein L2E82_11017 [Cichorium intybus]|uniref:Uncharacterized protein n=1 Tax=Cichorium intybus TaxID=13427 RepID=A0ACB9GCW4_CICIN|nr:hypothetical protein L2E82_11017 [Cichorium intybus]
MALPLQGQSEVNALKVFDEMPKGEVISWISFLTGYIRNGYLEQMAREKEEALHEQFVHMCIVATSNQQSD